MSRSKKKISVFTDNRAGTNKWFKRYANKIVRKSKTIADGKQYRKAYSSYNIRDWISFQSPEDKNYKKGFRK